MLIEMLIIFLFYFTARFINPVLVFSVQDKGVKVRGKDWKEQKTDANCTTGERVQHVGELPSKFDLILLVFSASVQHEK